MATAGQPGQQGMNSQSKTPICYIWTMKIRIRKKRKPNGKVWYIPERRVIPLIWRKIGVQEFFSKVLYRFPDKTLSNEYKYELTEPFDGYVYFLRQDLAEKYMGLYRRPCEEDGGNGTR